MIRNSLVAALLAAVAVSTSACSQEKKGGPPDPVRESLEGTARPSLLLTHAWFWDDENGKPRPGWARLDIWRPGADGKWARTRVEDPDSNVFHKAIAYDGGILTIGAEGAILKLWRFKDGEWTAEKLFEKSWGGQFDRLRDIEIGDVDADGKDEIVLATHDQGVVIVIDPAEGGGAPKISEMDQQPDIFVHEIEIGDIDGDGKNEFFATPSGRNRADASQSGGVSMYRWDGSKYVRSWVEHAEGTHAKEVLVRDLDGDNKAELFVVMEAEVDANDKTKLAKPVEIRQYQVQPDGSFKNRVIGTIPDRQTRFLIPGDFDGDGRAELIAPSLRAGIFYFRPPGAGSSPDQAWTSSVIERNSSGFEHAAYATDLDGDGKLELYVAADDQHELVRYDYDGKGGFTRTLLAKLDDGVLTWNISSGTF